MRSASATGSAERDFRRTRVAKPVKFNTDQRFVGLDALKSRHGEQVAKFENWAWAGDWSAFHTGHYDWWAFPIDRPSSQGLMWTVCAGEIRALNEDSDFGIRYRRGLELVALSWGWDIRQGNEIAAPAPHQQWRDWPIRLHKMTVSADLFGELEFHESLRKYGRLLIGRGKSMSYNGRDLSETFR